MSVNQERIQPLNDKEIGDGPVLYWMQREQRAQDNWALLYAQERALERKVPLIVLFNLVSSYQGATHRHYDFMLRGIEKVATELENLRISFILTEGNPNSEIPKIVDKFSIGEIVTDFNPMKLTSKWKKEVNEQVRVAFTMVDAHNIVPCWLASPKEEFAAHTFRPKIHKKLKEYLTSFPSVTTHRYPKDFKIPQIKWKEIRKNLKVDRTVVPVDWITPGTQAAKLMLRKFIDEKIDRYDSDRNDPNLEALSNLSPYLHFGQIAPQWVAYEVNKTTGIPKNAKEAFMEELIVRRELTDNFCYYNKDYDKVSGAHEWAQKTIAEHKDDKREYDYSRKEFEQAQTHDELWNAMQIQMVSEGKMHGWCRMYWAKKILEWTPDVQTAIDTALYLNDKYELDGRDPNGVVGVMWSICGVHDRAWTERPIFGKIRYMNFNGAKRKFDVKKYIEKYSHPKATLFDE